MKKGSILLALALAVLLGIGALGAGASGTAAGKKRCHFVKKKVHGKIRRVRVCTKPKPKPKPKVKNVSVSVDGGAQAKVTVGPAGGSITAERGGKVLTLVVPAGALSADTQLTVTPVASVRGLPKGVRFLAGAQFGPENLALAKPATLTIAGAKPGARVIAWFGLGRDVSRYPSSREGGSLKVQIAHFSGVAAVEGPATGIPDPTAALRARFAREIKPRLDRAGSEDPLESDTFAQAFAWEREVELLGLGAEFKGEEALIRAALHTALQNAIDSASTKCAAQHDLTQIERLTRLDRIAQLFGISISGEAGFQRALDCAHFELDMQFQSLADFAVHETNGSCVNDQTRQYELDVKTERAPIGINASASAVEGDAPLQVTKFDYTEVVTTACQGSPPFTCTIKGISAVQARPMHVVVGIEPAAQPGGTPKVTLTITPGAIRQTSSNCFDPSSPSSGETSVPQAFPADPVLPPTTTYRIDLTAAPHGHFVGGDVYATYGPETVEGTASIQHYKLTRSFVLRHTPQS